MSNLVKQRWPAVISGLMYGAAWEPLGLWPLAIAGWAWWMSGLRVRDTSAVFLHAFLFVLTAWMVAFHWVLAHPMPLAAMTSGIALLSYASIFAALTAWLIGLVDSFTSSSHPLYFRAIILTAILSTVVFETILFKGPFAMPWLSLGWSTAPSSWSLLASSLLGVQGLALLILVMAGLISLVPGFRMQGRAGIGLCVLGMLLFMPRLISVSPAYPESRYDTIRVRLLEPDLPPQRWSDVHDLGRIDGFMDALRAAAESDRPTDITVLPETALPLGPIDSLRTWVSALAQAAGSPVLSGAIERDLDSLSAPAYNVIVSSEEPQQRYAKRRLVPFAERVPFSDWMPAFRRLAVPAGGIASYARGKSLGPMRVAGLDVVPLICFESLFAQDARAAVLAGGSLLVITTQDGWWNSDHPRRQHLAFSQLLAASVGAPVIHATVDGESAVIDAAGRRIPMTAESAIVHAADLPLLQRETLYMRLGNGPFLVILGIILVLLLVCLHCAHKPLQS